MQGVYMYCAYYDAHHREYYALLVFQLSKDQAEEAAVTVKSLRTSGPHTPMSTAQECKSSCTQRGSGSCKPLFASRFVGRGRVICLQLHTSMVPALLSSVTVVSHFEGGQTDASVVRMRICHACCTLLLGRSTCQPY
ncbi:hypothetical protein ABBQ32_001481 [Trebouxia sp. C0010 RCD-2024]